MKIVVMLVGMCLIFVQSAGASRLGGGKSYGTQRSYSQQNYSGSHNYAPQGTAPIQQQQRSGMGAIPAAALGAAAGAAGGYLMGRSMSNNNNAGSESNNQQQAATPSLSDAGNHIPWGIISILGMLLVFGLMFFKRSKQQSPGFFGNTGSPIAGSPFSFSNNNQNSMMQQSGSTVTVDPSLPRVIAMPMSSMDKMPDGVESIYFLRQVKGMFLHLQSMNNAENVNEIEKYMTPELYQEMKNAIGSNSELADFSNLDCQLLSCETMGTQLIASVKFFGQVSEDPKQKPVPFSETWNFIKTDLNAGKWLIAGIQQDTVTK